MNNENATTRTSRNTPLHPALPSPSPSSYFHPHIPSPYPYLGIKTGEIKDNASNDATIANAIKHFAGRFGKEIPGKTLILSIVSHLKTHSQPSERHTYR